MHGTTVKKKNVKTCLLMLVLFRTGASGQCGAEFRHCRYVV